jgi:hypothetical protein
MFSQDPNACCKTSIYERGLHEASIYAPIDCTSERSVIRPRHLSQEFRQDLLFCAARRGYSTTTPTAYTNQLVVRDCV